MRGLLLRNLSLYTRNRHFSLYLRPTPLASSFHTIFPRNIAAADNSQPLSYFPSRIRFFSSDNETPSSDPNPESESGAAVPEEKNAAAVEVEDVSTKELRTQINDCLHNYNEEALPTIFASILKRSLSGKHVEADEKLMEEFAMKPLDNVREEDIESDFDEAISTDDEFEDLISAGEVLKQKRESDPFYNMSDEKWNGMIKEATEKGYLRDMRECEAILEDMRDWDKLLPDEIKKKVEVKFNEIGDRVEKGEISAEEGYEIFKEFEDQMVLECTKLMEAEGSRQSGKNDPIKDDLQDEGPILRWQTRCVFLPGDDQWHPKQRKAKLSVTVKELGLTKPEFVRLRALVGKRYNSGKDELTITSERFEYREENRKDCLRTLYALIEEAGKARAMVQETRVLDMKEKLKANPKFMQRLLNKKKGSASDPVTAS